MTSTPRVDVLARAVRHEPRRPQLGHESASMCWITWYSMIGCAELHPLLRERRGLVDQPLRRAAASRGDHQALVPEPLVGERQPVALLARPGSSAGTRTSSNATTGWCRRTCGCRRARGPRAPRACPCPRRTSRARPRAAPPSILRLEEAVVGRVERGDVHLHAVQDVVVAVPARRGGDRVDVGAGALLGDRVALVALAADRRDDPRLHLLLA